MTDLGSDGWTDPQLLDFELATLLTTEHRTGDKIVSDTQSAPRGRRPAPWRPEFLSSAQETAELAAELETLADKIESDYVNSAQGMSRRETARLVRLRAWAGQLDARPRNGHGGP